MFAKVSKNKKIVLILLSVLAVLVLLIAIGMLLFYKATRFEMFGKPSDIFMEEVHFKGSEITDIPTLKTYLKKFKNLKVADLGDYQVEAEDSVALRQEFPRTDLRYQTVVHIEDQICRTDIISLDISDHGITDMKTFMRKLEYLPELKKVTFGKQTLPYSEKEKLTAAFPDISFEVLGTYEIYGQTVLENESVLDLRDIRLDASVYDQLALLPELREVDLHDQPLSTEERIALAERFPDVNFGWTVHYGEEVYDSSITELDLSGRKLKEEDLAELKDVCAQLPNLEKLVVCDCGLSNETLAKYREEMKDIAKVVWRVYLGKWSLKTDAVAFSVLIFHYDYRRMTSNDIQVLKYCTDLRALDLGHQAISDLTVIGDYLPELRLLILADNRISDISPLAKLTHLHYLELFVNRIHDISPLAGLHELVDVNISYNGGLSDISALLNSPMMEKVWLESTSVSNASIQKLKETYPNAKVVRVGSGSVDQGWRWNPRYNQMMDMWYNDYYGDEFSKYDELAGHGW
ncbi:MAG: leucine-rich repeat domain-containing protein [Oscillospiraceae bacterium]|nr:leucine-rich repeat domain-containing protein [Oscillospiraceae bacterium]